MIDYLRLRSELLSPAGANASELAAALETAAALQVWLTKSIDRTAQKAKDAVEKDDQDIGMAALGALGALQLVQRILDETPADSVRTADLIDVVRETPAPPQAQETKE